MLGIPPATMTKLDKTDANQQLGASLNSNGLLMRMARSKGQQASGQRGLMNSSIGAEASQRAMVDAALPLAQQNTQFAQAKASAQQQADLTGKRDATLQGYEQANARLNASLTGQRDAMLQGYEQSNTRLNADLTGKRDASLFQQQLQSMSQQQKNDLAKLATQFSQQKSLNQQQQDFSLQTMAKQVAANTQGAYLSAIDNLNKSFGDQVATIQASAMKADEKKAAIQSLRDSMNRMNDFYRLTYQSMPTIKDDWINVDTKSLYNANI